MSIRIGTLIVHTDDSLDVAVELPRASRYDDDIVIPWYLILSHNVSISGSRAAMVAIRDALTAALDTHPDDSAVGGLS